MSFFLPSSNPAAGSSGMMTRKSLEQLRQVESAPSDKAASGDECQLESSSDASATFGDIPKEHSIDLKTR